MARSYLLAASLVASSLAFSSSHAIADEDVASDALPESETSPATIERLPLDDLRTFTKVYEQIRKGYVEQIDDSVLLEYAIKGMLSELDPHSAYLNESTFDDLQINTTGEFGGLGIEVGMEDGYVKVVSPIDGTPAEKAGLQSGDLIIKLDNQPVKGMTLTEAIDKMRGPKGSDITLTVVRDGADSPKEIVLTRDIIKVQSVRHRVLDDDYGYIRIAQFQVSTGADTADAIAKLKEEVTELKGIILDLRNNPGGVLQASVDVVNAFLDGGLVVYTEGRVNNSDSKYHAQPGDLTQGLPIVVLINSGSASASEIVAGALQDHQRAIILGTQSFGKGSVQTVIPLSDERAIKLTTALYFTPKGRSIQAQGIVPDIEVERARVTRLERSKKTTEADLSGRLDNGNGATASDGQSRASKPNSDLFSRDNQMFEALNLLKGLNVYSNYRKSSIESTEEDTEALVFKE